MVASVLQTIYKILQLYLKINSKYCKFSDNKMEARHLKIIIEATPKEIAALVVGLRGQLVEDSAEQMVNSIASQLASFRVLESS